MTDQDIPDPAREFGTNVLENVFVTWIEPELARRGLPLDRALVWAVVVELLADGGAKTTLNEEAKIAAKATASAGVAPGTTLTVENIEHLETFQPAGVEADSGWIVYVVFAGQPYLAFDFRYNKSRIGELLDLADDYLATAESSYTAALRPAIDNLYSAAELTVQAQMLSESQKTTFHRVRAAWLKNAVDLSNVPALHKDVLDQLHGERAAARYADGPVRMTSADLSEAMQAVKQMIDFARERAGKPITPAPPAFILGQVGRIDQDDQGAIAAWAQKTALMTMYISSAAEREGGHGVPPTEYHALYQQREIMEPLPNTLFWAARYTGSLRLGSVWVTPLALNVRGLSEPEFPHGYSMTIALGSLLLHGLRFTGVPFYAEVATEREMNPMWPAVQDIESRSLAVVSDEGFLALAHGREFTVAEEELVLGPMKSLMESPESRLVGAMIEMPAPCGKGHVIYYPAVLAQEGMLGRGHWFMTACECEVAYLVHTEHDGAHVKCAGEADRIDREYEALRGRELVLRDVGGDFVFKEAQRH
jgi:hypothetical protein